MAAIRSFVLITMLDLNRQKTIDGKGDRVRAAAAEIVKKLENTKVEAGAAGRDANIVAREGAEKEVHGETGGGAAVKTEVEAAGGAIPVKVRGVKNKPSSLETNFLHTFK